MKKSLVALAVLAASGAAMAQSTVSVYGIADLWVGQSKENNLSQTKLDSGGLSGSRFGLKGSEDLGGGLQANFMLEQGFDLDTGELDTAGTAFSRQAWVGLSGGFGEIQVGKVWTALDDVSGATNSGFDSALSATNNVFESTGFDANPANGMRYTTPEFGGFKAAISYSLGEDKTATLDASSKTAVSLQYASGPVTAVLGYQTEEPQGSGASTDYTRLGGAYDLGMVKLLASYGRVKESGADRTSEYQIGADVPLSGAMTLSAGYASSTTDNAAGAKQTERSGYGIALAYTLSKRTMVYAGVRRAEQEDAAGVRTDKDSLYAVGLKHTF